MRSCCCGPTAGGRVVGGRVGGTLGRAGRFAFLGRKMGAIAFGLRADAAAFEVPDAMDLPSARCLAPVVTCPEGGSKSPPDLSLSPAACLLATAAFSQYCSSEVGFPFPYNSSVGISRRHRASDESPSDPRLS